MQDPIPDPLDSLLDASRRRERVPEPAARLDAEVWRRIALAESAPPTGWRGVVASLESMFARPSFTIAVVAASVLLGLFLAEARVSREEKSHNLALMHDYMSLIDPMLERTDAGDVTANPPAAAPARRP